MISPSQADIQMMFGVADEPPLIPMMKWILLFLILAGSSIAWNMEQHENICRAAYEQLHPDEKIFDTDLLYFGCRAPDLQREMYPPHIPLNGIDSRFAIKAYASVMRYSLEENNIQDASFYAGVLSHFIADTTNPMHYKISKECHNWGEKYKDHPRKINSEVKSATAESIAEMSAEYASKYTREIEDYCKDNDTVSRDRVLEPVSARAAYLTMLAWRAQIKDTDREITVQEIESMEMVKSQEMTQLGSLALFLVLALAALGVVLVMVSSRSCRRSV